MRSNNEKVSKKFVRSFSLLRRNETQIRVDQERIEEKNFSLKSLLNKFKNKAPLNEKTLSDSACFNTTTLTTEEHAKPIFVRKTTLKRNKSENDLKTLTSLLNPRQTKKEGFESQHLLTEKYPYDTPSHGKKGSLIYISENGKQVMIMQVSSLNKLQIIAGTLDRLLMKLLDEMSQDFDYVDTYILCHSFFLDSWELLDKLMVLFYQGILPGEQLKDWQQCLQFKVLNVIMRWIKVQFQDFQENTTLMTCLEEFLNGDILRAGYTTQVNTIKQTIKENFHCRSEHLTLKESESHQRSLLQPTFCAILPNLTHDAFPNMCTKEIAKQLTLADFCLLKKISFHDYLHYQYKQERKQDYISSMTERVNNLSHWVISKVETNKTTQKQVVHKMIDIAKTCLEWNNFHTAMIITMALGQSKEISHLSSDSKQGVAYKQLTKYLNVSHNMCHYRTALKKASSPCVPFFPLILKDITFLLEGNSTFYQQQPHLINFNKFRQITETIDSTIRLTSENYTFIDEL
ncbi:unnamed protein product [Rhizopus stolonifer]